MITVNAFTDAHYYLVREPRVSFMPVNRHDMRCTAFHEAGHAVAAVLLNVPFDRVYIVQRTNQTVGYQGMQLGQVVRTFDKSSVAGKVDEAKRQTIQILAGPYGETLAYSNLLPDLGQDTSDVQDAFSVLRFALCNFVQSGGNVTFDPKDVQDEWGRMNQIIGECSAEAAQLIQKHAAAVGKVANELLSKGELTYDQVAALMGI
jgi:ATP-dependent Zn protease